MIKAEDFEERYGRVIDVDDLATVLSATRRETQALLRAHSIEPIVVGQRQVVAADRVASVLGLRADDAAVAEVAKIRREMSTRADGSRKGVREYLADARPSAAAGTGR
jgi:hypothetical protein